MLRSISHSFKKNLSNWWRNRKAQTENFTCRFQYKEINNFTWLIVRKTGLIMMLINHFCFKSSCEPFEKLIWEAPKNK